MTRPRRRLSALLVPLTALLAGLLFATSAETAQGTDLRADRRLQLSDLIAEERVVRSGRLRFLDSGTRLAPLLGHPGTRRAGSLA